MEGLVYDPINLEKVPINDYLNNDTNNIVIIHDNKYYGVNKSLFMFNNEMKRCIIKNGALLKKTTYDDPETFYNIGYFIGKKMIVNLKTLNSVLQKNRILELTSKSSGDTYINKELLELSTIGLLKKNPENKANLKYSLDDVYFNELITNVLKSYTGILYQLINNYLLEPHIYKNDNKPLNYITANNVRISLKQYVKKNIDFKIIINKEIEKIDKAFMTAAPRYDKKYKTTVFYRGMRNKYRNTDGNELYNVGEKAQIHNFTSITTNKSIAQKFTGSLNQGIIYKIYIDEGLPYINMVATTNFKHEKEYLLPRNIIFELISKKGNEYTVLAKPFKPDQFTIKTGCFPLEFYDITPTTMSELSSISSRSPSSLLKVKKDSGKNIRKSKDNIIPTKSKRCPKGMVRDKVTMECVPKAHQAKITLSVKVVEKPLAKPVVKSKLGRCPKGTRRNPKTLLCEAKA
jgi:hypothetical protein